MVITSEYYTCNRCQFRTTLLSRIEDHLLEHTSTKQPSPRSYFDCFNPLKPLKCISCNFNTEFLVLLRYHLVRYHDQQQFAVKATLTSCKKCEFRTYSNYLWIRHHIFDTCNGKEEPKKKKKRVSISLKKNGKWYLCKKCDFRTVHWSNLKIHVIHKHTPLEEIEWKQCMQCLAKFKTLSSLKRHEKIHVSMDYLYCAECDYSTPLRQTLVRHFNNRHALPEDIKWVECHDCGAKFKDKERLKRHLKKHSIKQKGFKCDQCPFKTHCKKSLENHFFWRHLRDEEVKWHNCQQCDYKAKKRWLLMRHIQNRHLESVDLVQCPHCSFKAKRKSDLTRHIGRFHDDSVLKCDLCGYQPGNEKSLQHHKKKKHGVGEKRHVLKKHNTDEEIFHCKKCDYNTPSRDCLMKHMRRKHKRQEVETIIPYEKSFITRTKARLQLDKPNRDTEHTEEEKLNCTPNKIQLYECDKCYYKSQHKPSLVSHIQVIHNDGVI